MFSKVESCTHTEQSSNFNPNAFTCITRYWHCREFGVNGDALHRLLRNCHPTAPQYQYYHPPKQLKYKIPIIQHAIHVSVILRHKNFLLYCASMLNFPIFNRKQKLLYTCWMNAWDPAHRAQKVEDICLLALPQSGMQKREK